MREGNYTVYKHVAPNGKVYIGITCQTFKARCGVKGKGYRKQPHFWNAIQKYGWDNIQHIIIAEGLTEEEASIAERKLIKRYDSRNPEKGYNHDVGGSTLSGGWHQPESAKAFLREIHIGEKNHMYGRHWSEEQKELRRKASSFKRSEETKKKMSLAQSNRSEEYKRKLYDAQPRTAIICLDTGFVFRGVYEAGRIFNIQGANISKCIRGERQKAGGLHWAYAPLLLEAS